MTGSHGWLAAVSCQKLHTCLACQKLKHHASWSTTGQLAVQLPRGWNSRLSQAATPSREPTLFWKTWLFTFHSHPSINTPFTHKRKRASRENFERETLKKNKINSPTIYILESLQIPLLSSSPLIHPWEVLGQILFSPYPYMWEGLFGALGSS